MLRRAQPLAVINMSDYRIVYRWLGRAALALVLVAMYLPMVMVFIYSFNDSRIGSVWGGFSTRWYGELAERRDLWDGLKASILVGVSASTLSVLLGTLAALGLRRWERSSRRLADSVLALP